MFLPCRRFSKEILSRRGEIKQPPLPLLLSFARFGRAQRARDFFPLHLYSFQSLTLLRFILYPFFSNPLLVGNRSIIKVVVRKRSGAHGSSHIASRSKVERTRAHAPSLRSCSCFPARRRRRRIGRIGVARTTRANNKTWQARLRPKFPPEEIRRRKPPPYAVWRPLAFPPTRT